MKSTLLCCAAAAFSLVAAGSETLTLVSDGVPRATIVLGERPTKAARFAAAEFRHVVKLITGAELPVAAEKPANEWQHVDAILCDSHVTAELNGVKIIDNQPIPGVTPGAIDGDEFVPGPILLQGDHSNASFKNMILTPIVQ